MRDIVIIVPSDQQILDSLLCKSYCGDVVENTVVAHKGVIVHIVLALHSTVLMETCA